MSSTRFTLAVILSMAVQSAFPLDRVMQSMTVNGSTATLMVPRETQVELLARINGARFPTFGPSNELLIGSNGSNVYRLPPPYVGSEVLVSVGSRSHSVAYRNGKLYVADSAGIYEADYSGISSSLDAGDLNKIIDLPTGGHSSRTVLVGPDDMLYLGIGISGNCSDEYLAGVLPNYSASRRRGGVWRIDESTGTPQLIAYSSGLRNPIGIAFNPATGELWATNAGSDNLGYEQPREVFSRLFQGSWHGMPWFQYINGSFQDGQCIDTDTSPRPASEAVPPSVNFDARSTPQGIAFVQGSALGSGFAGNALVAIHGSWATDPTRGNGPETRRPPKVVMVRFVGANPVAVEDAITGFQRVDGTRFARPSGAIMGSDGHFYFTSDGGEVQGLFRLRRRASGSNEEDGITSILVPILMILE